MRWPAETASGPRALLLMLPCYRLEVPRVSFLTFFFAEPRGVVRFAFGAAFLRAARFTALRAALSVVALVFAILLPFLLPVFPIF